MTPRHLVLAAGAVLLLGACSVGKPVPQPTTYVIEAAMPEATGAGPRIPETLRMGNVRMAAAFSGNLLVYRMDDVNFVTDPYQTFIADPGSMLGNVMATWLNRSGAFKSVTQPGSTQSAPYVLEATVTAGDDEGSRLTMHLHYGGGLWGPLVERLLSDEIERSRPRLLALLDGER